MPEVVVIDNSANVARAIFSPQMIDASGNITRAAFSLRHNENYISVCLMNVMSWMDDVKSIPNNKDRELVGYAVLNAGDIRNQAFQYKKHHVTFDIVDKHSENNKSHAGIFIYLDNEGLKGDRIGFFKPLPANISASPLQLRVQGRLLKLARQHFVRLT